MSGVLVAAALAGVAQMPVLRDTTDSFLAPSLDGTARIIVSRNGTIQTGFSGRPADVLHPPQWGGPVPVATMGDAYQVRLTHVSGQQLGDPEFDPLNTWLALSTTRTFRSFALSAGSYTSISRVEIRRASTGQILATGQYTLSWVVA